MWRAKNESYMCAYAVNWGQYVMLIECCCFECILPSCGMISIRVVLFLPWCCSPAVLWGVRGLAVISSCHRCYVWQLLAACNTSNTSQAVQPQPYFYLLLLVCEFRELIVALMKCCFLLPVTHLYLEDFATNLWIWWTLRLCVLGAWSKIGCFIQALLCFYILILLHLRWVKNYFLLKDRKRK